MASSNVVEAVVTDNSSYSVAMSFSSRVQACHCASSKTSRVTLAVTLGLPSRSPPIQLDILIGLQLGGGMGRAYRSQISSTTLRNWGTASHKEFSITANAQRASSMGVGRSDRNSSVCQIWEISSFKRLWSLDDAAALSFSISSLVRQSLISPCL